MNSRSAIEWISGAAIAALMLVHSSAFASTPPSWKNTLYLVPQGDTTLEKVFVDFRRLMNMPTEIADGVKGPTASLGQPVTVEALLDALALRHGLTWFVFRDRLYVSRQADAKEVRIKVIASRMAEVRNYLVGIKLLDDRFTWVELASRDEVMVQGPPAYVDLMRDNAASVKPAEPAGPPPAPPPEPQQVMTFRLKYASASDDVTGRLGVASLLTRLYGSNSMNAPVSASVRSLFESTRNRKDRLAAQTAASRTGAGDVNAAQAAVARELAGTANGNDAPSANTAFANDALKRSEAAESSPTFEADPRLNMVIVRDKLSRRVEYERVIAALDVLTEQIALDATIIELPVNAMRDALAAIASNASVATSSSGMPALVVPREVAERAFEQVSRERRKDGSAAIITQGLVFSEDDPFSLDFADTRTLPQHSTTIWETLASSLVPMKVNSGDTERRIGIKLGGTAKYVSGRGVNLKLELSEDRSTPERSSKATAARSTSAAMSVELREDQVLMLVNSSVWSGEDMNEPRARAVLLSAQRWQSQSQPPSQPRPPAQLPLNPPLSPLSQAPAPLRP